MRSEHLRRLRVSTWCLAALACAASTASAQGETITAVAAVKRADGTSASAPLTVVVRRYATDAERTALLGALKSGGTAAARTALQRADAIGNVQLGSRSTAIKYVYARPTGGGRLITVVTAEPILLVGADAPGAKPAAGFDLGLVILEVAGSGPGQGELVPATKIRLDQKDAIVTEDYHDVIVRLTNVAARPGGTR